MKFEGLGLQFVRRALWTLTSIKTCLICDLAKKYFSYPSLINQLFSLALIKLNIGLQIGGRLLIKPHGPIIMIG